MRHLGGYLAYGVQDTISKRFLSENIMGCCVEVVINNNNNCIDINSQSNQFFPVCTAL